MTLPSTEELQRLLDAATPEAVEEAKKARDKETGE